jgi:hypothetical protein
MSGIVGQNAGRDSGVVGAVDSTVSDNAIDETKLKDALVADFTEVVVTASDSILLGDATDGGNTKRDTVQGILDLASHTGNVAFPASQVASGDANTLDDYEEGAWTPVLSSGGSTTYTSQLGRYVKIGRLVFVNCRFEINSYSAGTKNRINGLPFALNSGIDGCAAVGYHGGLDVTPVSFQLNISPGGSIVYIYGKTGASNTVVALNIFKSSARIDFTMTYEVA